MAKRPEQIGKYRVIKELAQGGMGAVYTAKHPTLERTVIIKKLTLRGNADIRARFKREAQIMMELRSDAIVDVYDHFREGASYYIVLEYVDGPALDGLIRQRRYIPNEIALLIFREVCRGLAYAHTRNVVHRDIKPANVLLSKTGDAKLADFGIATIHGGGDSDLTREGMTLGTPSYMAPEQFQDTRSVDHRADIYSMGVVLYEMVTGKRPYPGSFTPEVLNRIQKGKYERPRKLNPKVWGFTQRLIRKMLNPKPSRRFSSLNRVVRKIDRRLRVKSPDAIKTAIENYVAGQEQAKVAKRHGQGWVMIAAAVALLATGVAFSMAAGYHRELLFPNRFGAVEIEVRISRDIKPPDNLYVAGQLFIDDRAEIPELPRGELRFRRVGSEENERFYVYRSQRIHAAPGAYRAKVEAESVLLWESFDLQSISERNGNTLILPGVAENAQVVRVDLVEQQPVPLEVVWTVRDRATGLEIDSGLRLAVQIEGRWFPWSAAAAGQLQTGSVYAFRVRHAEYREQLFTLFIKPFQHRLILDVALEPLP
ncbi:MAG: serine/threonine-protein kinase [Spirochaetales bacterium]